MSRRLWSRIGGVSLVVLVGVALVVAARSGDDGAGGSEISAKAVPDAAECGEIEKLQPRVDCLTTWIRDVKRREGLAAAMDASTEELADDPAIGNDCHAAWHPLGGDEGKRLLKAGEPMPAFDTSDFCRQGYAHGVVLGYRAEAPVGTLVKLVATDCGTGIAGDVMQCIHSYGHLFGQRRGSYDASLADCASIKAGAFDADVVGRELGLAPAELQPQVVLECAKGAAMERGFLARENDSLPLDECEGVREELRPTCYTMAPLRADVGGSGSDEAIALCDTEPVRPVDRQACAFGVGQAVAVDECSVVLAEDDVREWCRQAARHAAEQEFGRGTGDAIWLEGWLEA